MWRIDKPVIDSHTDQISGHWHGHSADTRLVRASSVTLNNIITFPKIFVKIDWREVAMPRPESLVMLLSCSHADSWPETFVWWHEHFTKHNITSTFVRLFYLTKHACSNFLLWKKVVVFRLDTDQWGSPASCSSNQLKLEEFLSGIKQWRYTILIMGLNLIFDRREDLETLVRGNSGNIKHCIRDLATSYSWLKQWPGQDHNLPQ